MTRTVAEAEAADRRSPSSTALVLMVDHTFVYTGAVRQDEGADRRRELASSTTSTRSASTSALPARHQRHLGPRAARPLDPRPPDRRTPERVSAPGADHVGSGYRGHRLPDRRLREQLPRPLPRQLAVAGQGAPDPDRRRADGCWSTTTWSRARRSRLRQRASRSRRRRAIYATLVDYRTGDMWAPKLESARRSRSSARTSSTACGCAKQPITGGDAGLAVVRLLEAASAVARRQRASGGAVSAADASRPSRASPTTSSSARASSSTFVNLYGCTIGDETRIGTFVEIQRNASSGGAARSRATRSSARASTIEDECFIGHDVVFINDLYPAAVTPDGDSAGGRRLEPDRDQGAPARLDRQRRGHPRAA